MDNQHNIFHRKEMTLQECGRYVEMWVCESRELGHDYSDSHCRSLHVHRMSPLHNSLLGCYVFLEHRAGHMNDHLCKPQSCTHHCSTSHPVSSHLQKDENDVFAWSTNPWNLVNDSLLFFTDQWMASFWSVDAVIHLWQRGRRSKGTTRTTGE